MSKYSYEIKKKIVLEYLLGKGGPVTLARKYGIPSATRIKEWVKSYQNTGDDGLKRSRQKKIYSFEYKLGIVELYLSSELSYMNITLAEKINNPCIITQWVSDFRTFGPDALKPRMRELHGSSTVSEDNSNENIFSHILKCQRQTYMYWQKRFDKENPDQKMDEKILEIHENNKDYGYRRICGELRNQGFMVNKKKVQTIPGSIYGYV